MKMLIFFSLSFIFISSSQAVNPYITKSNGMIPVCDKSMLELRNLPPVMDQGNYGLCYAHSTMLLLEYHRCSRSPNPQNCYTQKGSTLHLARFNDNHDERIKIGGVPDYVLSNFNYRGRKLSLESCAPYEKWHELDKKHLNERKKLVLPPTDSSEYDYFYYLSQMLKKDNSLLARQCWADEILGTGIQHNMQDLMAVLEKSKELSWQELRYQILVPKSCLKDQITYPDFDVENYPKRNKPKTFKGFRDHIYRSLSLGLPVEASFCSSKRSDNECNYHSASIVGQRQVCNRISCRLQFKIQNSYGKSWQKYNDDGWVDAENLSNLMANDSMGLMTLTPKGQKLNPKTVSPFYVGSPVDKTARIKHHNGEGECWEVDQNAVNNQPEYSPPKTTPGIILPPTRPINPNEKVMYICEKDGKKFMGDLPKPGWECVARPTSN